MFKINIRNIYKASFVIIGTIIGAGFASGQEIYTFFNIYGNKGLIGIFLSVFLIGYIISKTFNIVINNDINTYQDFILEIMPKKLTNNKILGFTINNIINIFLLISFNIMAAGFSTYFLQELNIAKIYSSIILAVLLFITLSKNIDGIVKINTCLIPILTILLIYLGIKKINKINYISCVYNYNQFAWMLKSVLYASYNSISLLPIIVSLKKYIKAKKEIKLVVIFTVIILLILSIILFFIINSYLKEINKIEIPIIYIANTLGKGAVYIYGIVVLMAIFTTAISSGYGFLNNVTKTKKSYRILSIIICFISIIIGQMKFSNLVNMLYPVFGYLGIIQILLLVRLKN